MFCLLQSLSDLTDSRYVYVNTVRKLLFHETNNFLQLSCFKVPFKLRHDLRQNKYNTPRFTLIC